ncbi:MAG: 1,4-dihydroxy-2-naphthoate polyprenyltransferase [Candidatus Hydrogenedentes bacterium]|jgi:1,4-dihydroxy-2-naphthoate octaprenyltransferase|nr:1,4-dihydroxy-2-naphthoate polyprenyltransferase [Candidatus Hydrogenedentota bacterium]
MSSSFIKIWFLAARPKTLPAAAAPVILGTAFAFEAETFHPVAAACALLGALLIQIAANYANDYYDYVQGADTGERLGPLRVTQAGLATPRQTKLAMIIALLLSALIGVYLVYRGGWPIAVIGILSLLFAVLYSTGPLPLAHSGIADLFVLVFFGPVAVAGTYYVQAQTWDWLPFWVGWGPGLLSVAILTVNNLRDVNQDRRSGKKTLVVRFGVLYGRIQYTLCILVAVVLIPILTVIYTGQILVCIAVLALAPAAYCMRVVFTETDGAALNDGLAHTGKALLLYAVLLSLGWIGF